VLGKRLQFIPEIRQFISMKIDFPAAEVQPEWQALVEGRGLGLRGRGIVAHFRCRTRKTF